MTGYLLLSFLSFRSITKYLKRTYYTDRKKMFSLKNHIPISLIVPAFNEQDGITDSIHSLLQLEYPEFQIIVVNDGSTDKTLENIFKEFSIRQVSFKPYYKIKCKEIKSVYISPVYPKLTVVNKVNGGKADAINAGINIAKYPLINVIDADSILERDCLLKVVLPFIEDENVVASGGTIRIVNGCKVHKGFITSIGLPKSWLVNLQIVEYIRAFIFGRSGFDSVNSMLIVSGAFGCFKKDKVMEVGGFKTGSIGEDMEIVIRMHKILRRKNPDTRITFVPDPVCWTEAPVDLNSLKKQRKRWQKGTIESVLSHTRLLYNFEYGWLGVYGFPYYFFIEMLGPVVEFLGYILFLVSLYFGWISYHFAFVFFIVAVLYGIIISVLSVIWEEISFRKYPKIKHLLKLFFFAVIENFGYRQLTVYWRFVAVIEYIFGKRKWGKVKRVGFQSK
ncbi:glycosyltransferase [Bacteroidota bacterium]